MGSRDACQAARCQTREAAVGWPKMHAMHRCTLLPHFLTESYWWLARNEGIRYRKYDYKDSCPHPLSPNKLPGDVQPNGQLPGSLELLSCLLHIFDLLIYWCLRLSQGLSHPSNTRVSKIRPLPRIPQNQFFSSSRTFPCPLLPPKHQSAITRRYPVIMDRTTFSLSSTVSIVAIVILMITFLFCTYCYH